MVAAVAVCAAFSSCTKSNEAKVPDSLVGKTYVCQDKIEELDIAGIQAVFTTADALKLTLTDSKGQSEEESFPYKYQAPKLNLLDEDGRIAGQGVVYADYIDMAVSSYMLRFNLQK